MNLLPKPQKIELFDGQVKSKKFKIKNSCSDPRIEKALNCFKTDDDGIMLTLKISGEGGERYTLKISPDEIIIVGGSEAGVFYAIQTLKQILENEEVPCLYIEDCPDMNYRGFYHDVTRGKIPKLSTIKKLIDTLAYYKINSLQLYIEHVFPFKETVNIIKKTGCLSHDEIKEIDDYCYENFIEFIPSIACFGHLYELLQQDKYKHLQCAERYKEDQLVWYERMNHHTIDPINDESIEIIKSMIDQYMPLFRSNKFNICCDETFDLKNGKYRDRDTGRLYVDFVKKIVDHVRNCGKQPMMWGDIVLQYPEVIDELPDDLIFLNWDYKKNPQEDKFKMLADSGKTQIVCPGTVTWSRLVECVDIANSNIINDLEYGYKYNADGMLNTNWGDYGNPCSLEMSMHGLVLGAAKAWNRKTYVNEDFENGICALMYKNSDAIKYITILDNVSKILDWTNMSKYYSNMINENKFDVTKPTEDDIIYCVENCKLIDRKLSSEKWERDEFRIEMLSAAKGLMIMAKFYARLSEYKIDVDCNLEDWLMDYRKNWLKSNKESELDKIEEMFRTLEEKLM